MTSRELGEFENIVFVSVRRLGDGAYCAALRAEIHALTGRDVRLERKGLLSSKVLAPNAEVGGRSKRRAAFARQRSLLERLYIGFDTAGDSIAPKTDFRRDRSVRPSPTADATRSTDL